jgi:TPR repeat protein
MKGNRRGTVSDLASLGEVAVERLCDILDIDHIEGNRMKIIRMIILLMLLVAQGLAWGGFEEGLAAAKAGDYATALREWKPLAELGNSSAQYHLGIMYENGQGIPQDYKEAVKWYRNAAEQGHAGAQYNLALMCRNGQGVPQNDKEAVKWYREAAEQGYYKAQNNLGLMYGTGLGVPQDYVQAYKWYNIAGANGDETGTKNRDIVAEEMTPAQITEAQKLVKEWFEKHQQ